MGCQGRNGPEDPTTAPSTCGGTINRKACKPSRSAGASVLLQPRSGTPRRSDHPRLALRARPHRLVSPHLCGSVATTGLCRLSTSLGLNQPDPGRKAGAAHVPPRSLPQTGKTKGLQQAPFAPRVGKQPGGAAVGQHTPARAEATSCPATPAAPCPYSRKEPPGKERRDPREGKAVGGGSLRQHSSKAAAEPLR